MIINNCKNGKILSQNQGLASDVKNMGAPINTKETEGVPIIPADESMKPEVGLHRRWTVHGVSHMLGLDVHDCDGSRSENYRDGELKAGMILTVEPGLYVHPDDEMFPAKYRGIGVRIEDDVLVTENGCEVLSSGLPTQIDEVEAWMAKVKKA